MLPYLALYLTTSDDLDCPSSLVCQPHDREGCVSRAFIHPYIDLDLDLLLSPSGFCLHQNGLEDGCLREDVNTDML